MAIVSQSGGKALERLNLAIKQLEGATAQVGFFPESRYPSGTPVAQVAAYQELGTGKIPPRPYFRTAIQTKSQEWSNTAEEGSKAILKGNASISDVMSAIGIQAQEDVKTAIDEVLSPPLSPITIGLRAYKLKYPDEKITGATIGKVARMLADGTLNTSGAPTKPLEETFRMIHSVQSKVETK